MMMGIGNSRIDDCDSAGVNVLLLAVCEEWSIHSVLTNQVIPWAQSSVRECDLGRKLVAYAQRHRIPAKKIDQRLVMLRDSKVLRFDESNARRLDEIDQGQNYRIFVAGERLPLDSRRKFISSGPIRSR